MGDKKADLHWKSAITSVAPNKLLVRGYRLDELMGNVSFSEMVYLLIKGDFPEAGVGKVLDAMLVACVDHGSTPPSTLAAITTASTGAPVNAALASGILSINRFHGGAIENCMKICKRVVKESKEKSISIEASAEAIVKEYREKKKRMEGFGHRVHTNDPRTGRIVDIAKENGVASDHTEAALHLEKKLEEVTGRKLPLNVDGAVAAILCDMGFEEAIANAFFIMARMPGLLAHIREEQVRFKPVRKIHPTDHSYDGPEERKL